MLRLKQLLYHRQIQTRLISFDKVQNGKKYCPNHPSTRSQNFYEITDQTIYTHLRLNIYPDGGVARLKVYGEVFKDWNTVMTVKRLTWQLQ